MGGTQAPGSSGLIADFLETLECNVNCIKKLPCTVKISLPRKHFSHFRKSTKN